MIRYFLAKGDRAGSATIIEGLDDCTCSNPPPRVQIATLYMKTYCMACKREGFIAPKGPRWPGNASNGKQWALSGDINACGCNPPPVFYAERGMSMTFTSAPAQDLTAAGKSTSSSSSNNDSDHWITFVLREAGNCEGLRCIAHFENGATESGVFDRNNVVRFNRPTGNACTRVELVLDDAPPTSVSVAESLLSAILG
jgi:hypothetical protein